MGSHAESGTHYGVGHPVLTAWTWVFPWRRWCGGGTRDDTASRLNALGRVSPHWLHHERQTSQNESHGVISEKTLTTKRPMDTRKHSGVNDIAKQDASADA